MKAQFNTSIDQLSVFRHIKRSHPTNYSLDQVLARDLSKKPFIMDTTGEDKRAAAMIDSCSAVALRAADALVDEIMESFKSLDEARVIVLDSFTK